MFCVRFVGGKIIAKVRRDNEAKKRSVEIMYAERGEPSVKRHRRHSEEEKDEMVEGWLFWW